MTQQPFRALAFLLLALAALAPRAVGDEDPDDWVARVGDRRLTRERLADTVYWRVRQELTDPGSGALTVLRQLVEEMIVQQEARRLGLSVSPAEQQRKFDDLDTQLRDRTNGAKNLRDMIEKEWGSSVAEFMHNLLIQLLKEKIAAHPTYLGHTLPTDEHTRIGQIEVVMAELTKKAVVVYGVPTALQAEPADLGPGVIATVNGEPLTQKVFAEALVNRLATSRIQEILEDECKAALTAQVALTPEEMEEVIEKERERWLTFREMTTQEALRTVSYEDWVKMTYHLDVEDLKQDRYFRGLYGLFRRYRAQVTDDEIREEYEARKDSTYGEAILVTDVQIRFDGSTALVDSGGGRSRKEALRLAHDLQRQHASGVPFDVIVNEINGRRDRTFFARRLRVRNAGNESILFERATGMQDGDVSGAFETLAEVHVMRRERLLPAPSFEEAAALIRESLAQRKAHDWLEEQLTNTDIVQIRWPPKED